MYIYIYTLLNRRRHPPPQPSLPNLTGPLCPWKLRCGTNYISRFGIKTRGVYRPTRINDTSARPPYVVPEKNTPRKTVTFLSLFSLTLSSGFFFDITIREGLNDTGADDDDGGGGSDGRKDYGTMQPTSFIKRGGRRPRSIWRQIDCNTAVSPKRI